jgi:flagellar export protein FliJ
MYDSRIARIIELKERLMEDRERELDRLLTLLATIDSNINSLECDITLRYDQLCTKELKGNEFTCITDYVAFLKEEKERSLEERARVEAGLAAIRAELTELLREIKILDKLRSKLVAREKKAANRKLQKLLDDMALRPEALIQ